ncbi:sulfatase family protein [Luteolibacter marinus]|uniref:sulfatase family protein n=1 Tax=Luteolibacter marinus TaxID=2776705 RepID=UPI00186860F2|nr:sulfatase [Luteolibacter marinus]
MFRAVHFLLTLVLAGAAAPARAADRPNLVILLADDMGYGDPSCYGHPLIQTPNLDRLAGEGLRLTSFVTGCWCVPSRNQLITGRYLPRVKFGGHTGADGKGGLPDSEKTLPEALKEAGYATHMVGKWHLGYKEKRFLPVHQGFDTWFGLPYSNDYMKPWVQTDEPLGLYRGEEMVEHPFDQDTLTLRYTAEAESIIDKSDPDKPFFLYLAYAMPHLPIHVSKEGRGHSKAGLYGDVIEELDGSVGRVLAALDKKGIADNTLVFFTSDNGPWTDLPPRMLQAGIHHWHTGSAGPLRGAKATTYEGGARVPAIVRWPGKVAAGGVSPELVGMPDIYRTFIAAGGGSPPELPLDGQDLTPFLSGKTQESPRKDYFYFREGLEAVREGRWKLRTTTGEPELYDMVTDPFERFNRAAEMPDRVAGLRKRMESMAKEVGVKVAGG